MGLRFAIIQDLTRTRNGDKLVEERVVLEYSSEQVQERIKVRIKEHLISLMNKRKKEFTIEEAQTAFLAAYQGLEMEFKEETVRLK